MLPDKETCCGCSACYNACKFNAIKKMKDKYGFIYFKRDMKKCVNCLACERVCPILKKQEEKNIPVKYYAGFVNSELETSASGGIASALNRYFINNNCYICGVVYNDDFKSAKYIITNKIEDMEKIKSSKYIQIDKEDTFKKVQKLLINNKKVLFIGLPCDVAGLKSFLVKDFKNLYTVSLICMGPTSQIIQEKFIDNIESKKSSDVTEFNVRSKKRGWGAPNHIYYKLKNGKDEVMPFNQNAFGRSFEIIYKDSCTYCKFKLKNSKSDMIIGDYWGVQENDEIYNKKGVSTLIFNNEKLFNIIKTIKNIELKEITYDEAIKKNEMLIKSRKKNQYRDKFMKEIDKKGLQKAYKKYDSYLSKIERKILKKYF